ncbi:MAG TPA: sulfurtransferase [Steroidobacteraceae bacterium]|jgi:thiosulfate/3-mercaptopyruvate sulfurtransferase
MYTTLIDPAELAAQCANPDWAIIDCRFDLARPQWGAQAYAAAHIPGAIYAHLDQDLSGRITPHSGRHPLPEITILAETLGGWGIDSRVQVTAYDQGNGAYAARLWWLLRWLGHPGVAVLNGGFAAWQQADLPVSVDPTVRAARRFTARPEGSQVVPTEDLARWVLAGELTGGSRTLIDARSADRFAGQNETLDPVAGHVPGALNHPFARNLDGQGRFLPAAELRARWLGTLRGRAASSAIAMCGSGVTACHDLLALEVAGLLGAQLYAGSWSEWIRDVRRPVEPPR